MDDIPDSPRLAGLSFCAPADTLNAFFDEHYLPHCVRPREGIATRGPP